VLVYGAMSLQRDDLVKFKSLRIIVSLGVCGPGNVDVSAASQLGTCPRLGHWSGPSVGRVGPGWDTKFSVLGSSGRVGSGPVSQIYNKYAIYTRETDYSWSIIHNDKKL